MKTLGEKIVEGRKKLGMSQELFADKMGVTRQMVSRWELDDATPRMQKVKKISEVLGVSVEDLLNGEEINPNPEPEISNPVATNNFNYKALIKIVAITLIVLVALYLLYSGYKLIVLNVISSKVSQYKTADNYYIKVTDNIDEVKTSEKEIWYKDGKYKIVTKTIVDNITNSSIKYFDLNNKSMFVINDNEKTYSQFNLYSTDIFENGKYMYSLYPAIIKKDSTNFNEYIFGPYIVYCYFKIDKLSLKINNELVEFDKDTLLPTFHSISMKQNKNKYEDFSYYNIKLDIVEDKDVTVSSEYKKIN